MVKYIQRNISCIKCYFTFNTSLFIILCHPFLLTISLFVNEYKRLFIYKPVTYLLHISISEAKNYELMRRYSVILSSLEVVISKIVNIAHYVPDRCIKKFI